MRALLALLLASGTASAATIGGRLSYPSEELPGMIVVARDSAGATFRVETKAGQARYRLEVPAGAYVVFAIPLGTGTTSLRGAYTEYSVCGRDKAKMMAGGCPTGPLVTVTVGEADRREDIDLDDWYMPEALMATLNLAISEAPAPRGNFAAYPADSTPPASTRTPDFDSAPAALKYQRSTLQRAASRGPFYAGRIGVARWGCGQRCQNWALVDIATGRITYDAALQPLRGGWPCDADALEFRDDSRLLRLHRAEGANVVTQEFLWDNDRLRKSAESTQSAAEFCRR
jgi:hypothetical protein